MMVGRLTAATPRKTGTLVVLFPAWAPTYLVLEALRRGACFLFDLVSRRLPAGNSASFESAVLPTLVELMER